MCQFGQIFLKSLDEGVFFFLNNKQVSSRLFFRLFAVGGQKTEATFDKSPKLCCWHLIKPNGKQYGHRLWRLQCSSGELVYHPSVSFLIFNHNRIGLDCIPHPTLQYVTEFNHDVMQFMFSLRGGKREQGKLYAKQKRKSNKREENETRQRDPSNNRTTMSTQCGFSSPAEKGLKQRKSTCSRLPQSKTVLCIRPKQHHSCPLPNSTELCRTYPVTLKAGLRLWSTTHSAICS